MVRELKFRVWDGTKMLPAEDITQAPKYRTWLGHFDYGVPMQYTGFHDDLGVEIYERDIVYANGQLAIISWNDAGGFFDLVLNDHADDDMHIDWLLGDALNDRPGGKEKLLVIGNIHENPELLNQANAA
ncbi:YopX protein [Rhodococcus rhodochrous ATCC 21198]|nr:YopX family protein [Rhodococcus aetherivorans]ETT25238.1 YopX protein [Rhodococcus rhodochrous ATCC 21198]MDV6295209.1 YopX family protein [Rhodococcus aetherivorans]NGP28490.1 hypothetical protein [Rhodococcus aetherivorans]